jgi:AcrR family transcriptional regulator
MARTSTRRGARTQQERSDETTSKIVRAASATFAAKGFAATSIDDINAAANVTRGALYHHFASKTDVFRVVFEEKEQELVARISAAAAATTDPWAAFCAGCRAFLAACLDPAIQRIVLIDGPAVLDWETIREIESRSTLALIQPGLAAAMKAGRLGERPVEPLSHLLLGALSECAKGIARAAKPRATLKAAEAELDRLLAALR